MVNIVVGLCFLILGSVFAIFHKELGRRALDFYLHHQSEKAYQLGNVILGVIFVIFGLSIISKETIGGIILIIMGGGGIIFCRKLARKSVDFYLHYHFSEKACQLIYLVGGIVFAILGLLAILHFIRFD